MKALGSHIFAGGFTVGVSKHFEVLGHLEGDNYGVRTARMNFPDMPIEPDPGSWDDAMRGPMRGKVDFVYGNPPCAAWSAMNNRRVSEGTWRHDPRVQCTRLHFTLLERARPWAWAWESVDRAFSLGRPFVDELTSQAVAQGYSVTHLLVDGQYVGTPHRRKRYFMVAHKMAVDWEEPSFEPPKPAGWWVDRAPKRLPNDCPDRVLPPSSKRAYRKTAPGKAIRYAWEEMNPQATWKYRVTSTGRSYVVGRPAFKAIRLDPERVCPTVVGTNLLHHREPRYLSAAEMRKVCGYPARFKLEDLRLAQFDLLTRAVMPPAGEWLAGQLARAIERGKRTRPRVWVVDFRQAPGRVEEIL